MKDFFKKNGCGIAMAAGVGLFTWLAYFVGKCNGWVECYNETDHSDFDEIMEVVTKELESE